MNYKKLGNTDLKVSTICLGTMTWGEQNTQNEGFEQMDYALDPYRSAIIEMRKIRAYMKTTGKGIVFQFRKTTQTVQTGCIYICFE